MSFFDDELQQISKFHCNAAETFFAFWRANLFRSLTSESHLSTHHQNWRKWSRAPQFLCSTTRFKMQLIHKTHQDFKVRCYTLKTISNNLMRFLLFSNFSKTLKCVLNLTKCVFSAVEVELETESSWHSTKICVWIATFLQFQWAFQTKEWNLNAF